MGKFTLSKLVRNMDKLAEAPSSQIKYNSRSSSTHQTFLGGFCTLIGYTMFIVFVSYQAEKIYYRENPEVIS